MVIAELQPRCCVCSPYVGRTRTRQAQGLSYSTTPRLADAHCENAAIEFPWLEADVQREKRARTIKVWHFWAWGFSR